MIKNVCIVGMGALGLLFGQIIKENRSTGELFFLMDENRKKRHEKDIYTINGNEVRFDVKTPKDTAGQKVDLLIIATKYDDLDDAIKLSKDLTDKSTVIISLLNGITSEEILAETFDRSRIIDCVPIGMDAMRDNTSLTYTKTGKLQIGIKDGSQRDALNTLSDFYKSVDLPHEICEDIAHAMWNKYMMNVGINQACMVYETSYSGVFNDPVANADLKGAMQEVIDMAKAAGVNITDEDYEADMKILKGLAPDGYPSMRQDAVAKRKSEVEMFAGEMIRLSEKYNVPVPVNKKFYQRIREIEAAY